MGQAHFRGGVMTPGQGEAAEATITVCRDYIEAQTIAGAIYKLSYATMILEASDTASGVLVCRDTALKVAVICQDPAFTRALIKFAGRNVRRALAPNSKRVFRQQATRMSLRVIAVGVAGLLLWATPKWVRYGLRSVAQVTPLEVDNRLGEAWLKNIDLGGQVLVDNPWKASIDELVGRLVPNHALPTRFSVSVVDAPELDAWALPGGPLVFKTGLLRRLTDPSELAGLVAHEMAHVTKRHLMQRLSQTLGVATNVQFFFGDIDAVMRTPPNQLQLDVLLRPEDESEADRVAIDLLVQAHLDPHGIIALVATLAADAQAGMTVPWLQRGPPTQKRLADLRGRIRRLRPAPAARP